MGGREETEEDVHDLGLLEVNWESLVVTYELHTTLEK